MRHLLNPERALVFRITHRDNLRWILLNGLHCPNSERIDPNFVSIGNPDLIIRRHHRAVPVPPGGSLSDYVPFYFTPWSVMLYNIKTGYRGIRQRRNDEIIFLVSSLRKLRDDSIPFLFTDRHAYLKSAEFYSDFEALCKIEWASLQNRDFKRDNDDLEKLERYQAEALIHRYVPVNSLLGIACCGDTQRDDAEKLLDELGGAVKVVSKSSWYF